MRTLCVHNVPDDVAACLERLAAREGLSLSAFAARELAIVARRDDSQALLADLPDHGVAAEHIVADVERGRAPR